MSVSKWVSECEYVSVSIWVWVCECEYMSVNKWVSECECEYGNLSMLVWVCESGSVCIRVWVCVCESVCNCFGLIWFSTKSKQMPFGNWTAMPKQMWSNKIIALWAMAFGNWKARPNQAGKIKLVHLIPNQNKWYLVIGQPGQNKTKRMNYLKIYQIENVL